MTNAIRWKSAPLMRHSESVVFLIIFISAMVYFDSTVHLTLELRDEGFLLYRIARVADGEIPNRDFIEEYGIGVYALTAPIFELFGKSVYAIRELLVVIRALGVALSYAIARHFVSRPFALIAAFIAAAHWGRVVWAVNTPYAALLTVPICMSSLALLLHGQTRGSRGAYFWSGIVCGAALTFKWTLAAVSAYGMVLAICAGAMLQAPPPDSPRSHRAPVLLAWVVAAAAIVVPFHASLSAYDYLLHIAPIHLLIGLIGFRFARFGDGRAAVRVALPLVARYCIGFIVIPGLVAALYLSWGALGDLFYNTVQRPLHYRNYYESVRAPRFGSLLLLVCVVAWVTAVLAGLRRSYRVAIPMVVLGALLAPIGFATIQARGNISSALEFLLPQLPAISAFATLAFLAVPLARSRSLEPGTAFTAVIAALFFQEMMSFQIFPRISYNAFFMLPTLGPVFAYLCYRGYSFASADDAPTTRPRRVLAFVAVALVPVLTVGEIVRTALVAPGPSALAHTALRAPALAGIRPRPDLYEREDLAAFDALIVRLERLEPADAPIFAVQNEPMIYFLSERKPLFADHGLVLFLAGWGMLPANDPYAPSPSALIERLSRTPDAIVVIREHDKTTRNFIQYYPQVMRYIRTNFGIEYRIGDYRILRRIEAT